MTLPISRPRWPLCLVVGLLLVASFSLPVVADGDEIGATTVGARVLLLPNGSWVLEEEGMADVVEAIADDGRRVVLMEQEDPETGRTRRIWRDRGGTGGLIQVIVSRTIQTDATLHSDIAHCIPVVTARNLSEVPVERLVADIEFTAPDERKDAASLMFGPLDPGEEHTVTGPPLLLERCVGLTGDLVVPFCAFQNDIRCESLVLAGGRGVIPLAMGVSDAVFDPGNRPGAEERR